MWNNPEVLSKLGKAMGNVFEFPGALEAGEGEEGEGEEADGAVEETVHGAASAGECPCPCARGTRSWGEQDLARKADRR
jgi:hypothetical protein